MKISEIMHGIECSVIGHADIDIKSLQYDSRNVTDGDLFFCISGFEQDGHKFAQSAVDNGAAALVVTKELPEIDCTQILVADSRKTMAQAACNFYGQPSKKMKMIGITGTNGKTTTTYMMKRIAEKAGFKVGLIGTIQNMIGDKVLHTERTTPESIDLQHLLYDMYEAGCGIVVMEVSSHSLVLDRTYGIEFDVGIFSNLTQDHLDFHKTWDEYIAAKAMLFAQSKISVINTDDDCAQVMIDSAKGEVFTYSIDNVSAFKAENIVMHNSSTEFTCSYNGKELCFDVAIPGRFTVYNSLAAASAAIMAGISEDIALDGLKSIEGVPGRFESLPTHNGCTLILDYAHTPDSLENTLKTAKGFAKGKVVSVFGCGGNRDKTKRPKMAEISVALADFTVVTTDNPRFEVPADIIKDIVAGIADEYKNNYICIEDRREAIYYALKNADTDDVILLAGKGHETYQEIKGVKYDFDEKVIVAQIVEELKKTGE